MCCKNLAIPLKEGSRFHLRTSNNWNVTTHFQGQFNSLNESIKPYIPEFNYVLVDLTKLSNEEIEEKAKTTPFLYKSLQLMKLVAMRDIENIKGVAVIAELSKEEKIILLLYLYYTLDVDQDTMQRIVKELGGEELMPSLAEKLIKQGKQDLLIKQLRRKFGLSSSDEKMIRSVTDESKLDAAAEAVLDAKSKDEVLKLLGR
ncbi:MULTISPECIES: DUF4351 domain-containing protein [Acetomicrobium]|uniref:DUF4351 domain-containing protein n=1 Tax=Acetomicrobium TaxID=49894 RepID=UPI002989FFD7|nr:DUF4351 domain-containing protein [Acetomicrobium sp.]